MIVSACNSNNNKLLLRHDKKIIFNGVRLPNSTVVAVMVRVMHSHSRYLSIDILLEIIANAVEQKLRALTRFAAGDITLCHIEGIE